MAYLALMAAAEALQLGLAEGIRIHLDLKSARIVGRKSVYIYIYIHIPFIRMHIL